jgi:protein gp37
MNKTGIQYLDFTWNPVTGCTKGCPECWAREVSQKRLAPAADKKFFEQSKCRRFGDNSLPDYNEGLRLKEIAEAYRTFAPTLHPERLNQPARRKKPAVIGVCFMGDLFDPACKANWFSEVACATMSAIGADHHTYVFLTKQPAGMAYRLKDADALPHWHLGFSARTQAEFDEGWPHMAKLAAAGWKVWVSLEPMQEAVDIFTAFDEYGDYPFDSVIVGAQSGKNAVPFQEDWARLIRDQCAAAGVPFMFKQGHDARGKVVSLPELDGVVHDALAWGNKCG